MGKPLNNRQRVKNPRKRERYAAPKKVLPTEPGGTPQRKRLEALLKRVRRRGAAKSGA